MSKSATPRNRTTETTGTLSDYEFAEMILETGLGDARFLLAFEEWVGTELQPKDRARFWAENADNLNDALRDAERSVIALRGAIDALLPLN